MSARRGETISTRPPLGVSPSTRAFLAGLGTNPRTPLALAECQSSTPSRPGVGSGTAASARARWHRARAGLVFTTWQARRLRPALATWRQACTRNGADHQPTNLGPGTGSVSEHGTMAIVQRASRALLSDQPPEPHDPVQSIGTQDPREHSRSLAPKPLPHAHQSPASASPPSPHPSPPNSKPPRPPCPRPVPDEPSHLSPPALRDSSSPIPQFTTEPALFPQPPSTPPPLQPSRPYAFPQPQPTPQLELPHQEISPRQPQTSLSPQPPVPRKGADVRRLRPWLPDAAAGPSLQLPSLNQPVKTQ